MISPPAKHRRIRRDKRRGVAVIEAVLVLPLLVIFLFGAWEVGRLVQVNQLINSAAREGARTAAGGTVNGTDVTVATVQQTVRDYMTAAGLPSGAVSGSQITLTNTSSHTWTDPCDAQPGDTFRVRVAIPSGTAFNSMKIANVGSLTGVNSMTIDVFWASANDEAVAVDDSLPY